MPDVGILQQYRHFGKTTEERSSAFEVPALHSATDFCRMKEKSALLPHKYWKISIFQLNFKSKTQRIVSWFQKK